MAITIEFDGTFRKKISNVSPSDIVHKEKQLFVKGVPIPVIPDRLYDLLYLLNNKACYKHGKVCVVLCTNGDIKYHSKTSNFTADYYVGRIMNYGTIPHYYDLDHKYGEDGEYISQFRF